MLTESCVIFFCRPEPFKALFWPVLSTGRNRERRDNKACSKTAGGRDLVQFKLELTPNHQNSLLENTSIRFTRYFFVPVPNQSFILPIFSEKSDPEVSKVAFSTWSVQDSRPKEFKERESIRIYQSARLDCWRLDRWAFELPRRPKEGRNFFSALTRKINTGLPALVVALCSNRSKCSDRHRMPCKRSWIAFPVVWMLFLPFRPQPLNLLEHRADIPGKDEDEIMNFFRLSFRNCVSCVNNYGDLVYTYFFIPQFKYMSFIYS